MKHYLIPESGRFYKANLHTHTTCSDGCKTPEEIKEIYKAHGYSVVAYTDHDVMINHSDLNDENFLAITSHEVETNGTLAPTPALAERVNQWNVSPKLAHSGNDASLSLCPQVLAAFCATQRAWFKFVVQAEEDWQPIAALQLPRERIILMPCATNITQLSAARLPVAQLCLRHRVRFGDRLHIALWNDTPGV